MGWLFEKRAYHSEKNGLITCRRIFGRWKILVKGAEQSSTYVTNMWRNAIARTPFRTPVSRILILGLGGGGGSLSVSRQRFPNALITVVEWDPVMVKIWKDLNFFQADERVTIMLGDASEVVPNLTKTFDLILCDLFFGWDIQGFVAEKPFLLALRRVLSRNGLLVMNFFQQKKMAAAVSACFLPEAAWRFQYNALARFTQKEDSSYSHAQMPPHGDVR